MKRTREQQQERSKGVSEYWSSGKNLALLFSEPITPSLRHSATPFRL